MISVEQPLHLVRRLLDAPDDGTAPRMRDSDLAFLQHQQIASTVHHLLEYRGWTDDAPEALRRGLRAAVLEQWQRAERWSSTLGELHGVMGHELDRFTVLKGLGLALLDYGGSDRRAFSDLDLLVQEEDVDRVLAALEAIGFETTGPPARGRRRRFLHQTVLRRGSACIDLHHQIRCHPSLRLSDTTGHRERRRFHIRDIRLHAPSAADQLLTVLLGLHTDIALSRARLKSAVDVVMLLRDPDLRCAFPTFLEERRPERTRGIVTAVLALVERLFPGSVPEQISGLEQEAAAPDPLWFFHTDQRLARKRWALRLYPQSELRSWWHWARSMPSLARSDAGTR